MTMREVLDSSQSGTLITDYRIDLKKTLRLSIWVTSGKLFSDETQKVKAECM